MGLTPDFKSFLKSIDLAGKKYFWVMIEDLARDITLVSLPFRLISYANGIMVIVGFSSPFYLHLLSRLNPLRYANEMLLRVLMNDIGVNYIVLEEINF